MKKLAIFIVALAFLNFGGGGGGVSSQSNFDSMIQTVRDYYELNVAAGRTGNNWLRVLIAFGAETHDSLTPFTAAEAWERVPRWGGWRPVAEALDQLEAQSAPALPTSSPMPTAMPTSAPLPTNTPLPTSTLIPTSAPLPTNTLAPTSTPWPTNTPAPTSTPLPTSTPRATPTIQSVQFEPPQAAPLQAEPAQAKPQPTSWEAWVTKEPEDAYKARFTYDVPEGKMVKFKTTLHVQLTPANASVNNVVVNLQTSDTRNLNVHALKISDVDISTTFRFVTRSASAWTDQGGGHYTRPLYVTFQTVDDDIVKSRDSLGAISIFTSNIDKQIRRGAGSQVEFIHGEDDLTFPKLGGLSYTSNTTGSYAVVSGRMATAPVVVSVNVSGDVSMVTHARHTVEIPGHSSYGTEVRALRDGHVLTFTCTGTGMGVGELVLTPHWNSTGQMLDNYSHRMQVCPNPAAVKAARQKVSNFSTATFRMRLTCAEWRNIDGSPEAIAAGWENLRVVPAITVAGYYGNIPAEPAYLPRVCNVDFLHVWELLGPQTTQVKCTVGEKMVKALDDGNVTHAGLADRIRQDIRPDYEYRCFE